MSLLEKVNDIYKSKLKTSEAALNFIKERGLDLELVKEFEIGFSADDCLKDLKRETLYSLGLVNKSGEENNKNRLMFPIRDEFDRLVGFNGRSLDAGKLEGKYRLSPEYAGFFKSQLLYNFHRAKNEIKKANNVYVVEGVLDAIAMHQSGIKNVVCVLGTDISRYQVELLSKYTRNFTLVYDGDMTGFKKTIKSAHQIKLVMEQIDPTFNSKERIRVLMLPEGKDPGDYFHEKAELISIVNNPKTGLEFIETKFQIDEKYKRVFQRKDEDISEKKVPK